MIGHYDWADGREAWLRFGPDHGPVVVIALPLFEEANRTRAFAVAILRALAARGIGGMLPDLPGQGDSMVATEQAGLDEWRQAFAAACDATGRPVVVASIRSGALVDWDAQVVGRWHLAPQSGARLVVELDRIQRMGGTNATSDDVLAGLSAAVAVTEHPVRVVRLGSDPAPADLRIDATPLWRRAEPGQDLDLAETLADDLAGWTVACAGR